MQTREKFIKNALSEFLIRHSAEGSVSAIDDIILKYMTSILEDLGDGTLEDDIFDVDQFTETMEAYLPGFQDINSVEVSEWMFDLASRIGNLKFDDDDAPTSPSSPLDRGSSLWLTKVASDPSRNGRERTESCGVRSRSSSSATSNSQSSDSDEVDQSDVETLREMFPDASTAELIHCLVLSDSSLEDAALWALHRLETGESLTHMHKNGLRGHPSIPEVLDDHVMKKSIVEKYSYVDTDEDKKHHRPLAPKSEPKKLIRYLDSKVVSVKGERFTEIKKPEDEEAKNTYINLKPAKQYRFH